MTPYYRIELKKGNKKMLTANDLYKGNINPEKEIEEFCSDSYKDIAVNERRVIECLTEDQRNAFDKYVKAVRSALHKTNSASFKLGMGYGAWIMSIAGQSDI